MKQNNTNIVPIERVISKIYLIRGNKVMIDKDLAELYEVETKSFTRTIKRNIDRFPSDFMFQLNKKEFENLRSHFGTSSWGGRRYLPYVFTEQGVAMLSSVLNSKKAIQVNIQIIRTFTKLRELLSTNKELKKKVETMEKKYDTKLSQVFEILKQLIQQKALPKKPIGFRK